MNLTEKIILALQKDPTNIYVKHYLKLVKKDFYHFLTRNEIKNKLEHYHNLLEIGDKLNQIAIKNNMENYAKISIAGGFSAGKSEFISSLFKNKKIRLASSIEPTTAIPTYIFHKNNLDLSVYAKNNLGKMINLSQIYPNIHLNLSHKHLQSSEINMKNIIPELYLTTALQFQHICFIDTPGYNPSQTKLGSQSEDHQTAFDFTQQADAIIWLIGLDANGTIPQSDLQFLEELQDSEQSKPLYIVLNKADLRPQTQIEDIMETIIDTLDDYGIEYEGITAYSSKNREHFGNYKYRLDTFIKKISKNFKKENNELVSISKELDNIKSEILQQNDKPNSPEETIRKLYFTWLNDGFENLYISDEEKKELYEIFSKLNKEILKIFYPI